MCDLCLPRRAVLGGLGTVAVAGLLGPIVPTPAGAQQPAIVPRSQWGPQLAPTGPIAAEPDVRFLLVHHTVNANTYAAGDVVGLLGAIYSFHTGPERGWPDIAYNFFVDRFGTVYEGRTGSLAGAVAGDASGGSQGFAQLCTFIGDHSSVPPSAAAQASMAGLLGFLGARHGLDLSPGATATFTSRGSNRHPAGASVTTPTISGHRDMSTTACPGDAAYAMVADGTFARLASGGQPAPPTTSPPPPPPPPPTTTTASTTTSTSTTSTSTTRRRPRPPPRRARCRRPRRPSPRPRRDRMRPPRRRSRWLEWWRRRPVRWSPSGVVRAPSASPRAARPRALTPSEPEPRSERASGALAELRAAPAALTGTRVRRRDPEDT